VHAYTHMLVGLRRRVLVISALVLALAVVGTALSASTGAGYRGKVKSGGRLSFRTTATKVVGFKASVSPLCVSLAAGSSMLKVYLVRLQTPKKLKNGHFKITFHGASSTFITVTGTIKGKSASGRIDVHYTLTSGTVIYACSQKTTWTARKT